MPVAIPTNAFIDTLRYGSYLVDARCTVYQNGQTTNIIAPLSTMTVTVDRNSANRRQGQITIEVLATIPPQSYLPTNPASLLAPFGTELFIESGIAQTNTSDIDWIPLGLFSIATSTVQDTTIDMTVTLDLYDRSWVIGQRAFITPYNFPATTTGNFVDEIEALLNSVWGSPLSYNIVPTSAVVPVATYNPGSNPWSAALDMAAAVGYELFFNANGVVTGYPVPDPTTQPITWNFTDDTEAISGLAGTGSGALLGSAYSTPVATTVQMTRDQIYNDVFITGSGSQNTPSGATGTSSPVIAQAADTNPLSPTNIYGPMGNVPEFVATNLVTSSSQAQDMANNDLQAALAAAWQITISCPPNPLFDIDDVVTITRPRLGLSNIKVVIDTITHTVRYDDLTQLTGRVVN